MYKYTCAYMKQGMFGICSLLFSLGLPVLGAKCYLDSKIATEIQKLQLFAVIQQSSSFLQFRYGSLIFIMCYYSFVLNQLSWHDTHYQINTHCISPSLLKCSILSYGFWKGVFYFLRSEGHLKCIEVVRKHCLFPMVWRLSLSVIWFNGKSL